MRAETLACRAAAVGFCVLLSAVAPVIAQPPHVIYAELKGRD